MAAGAYIFAPAGTVLTPAEAAFFRDADPWGFILFVRNVEAPEQLATLTSDMREAVGRDAPVLIDQEGGRVQRMAEPHWRRWLPPLDQPGGARAMWLRYRLIAAELRAVGIDVNCVPCADIAGPDTHPFLRNRCLGQTADEVLSLARAVVEGCLAGGVLPVAKHMPGHGRAISDSHHEPPRVSATRSDLEASDFKVFRGLSDLPLAMTSHVVYEEIDAFPTTHSARVISLIRDDLGIGGLLLTDDISMNALEGTVAERGARALAAGCDVVLHCNGELDQMRQVATLGRLSDAASLRADRALAMRKPPDPVDIAALAAEFDAIL